MAGALILSESSGNREPDIETAAFHAQVAILPPAKIALHLVNRIEPIALNETLAEAKRHGSVVCEVPCFQIERSPADHRGDRIERAGRLEFKRGAERVATGQSKESAKVAIADFKGVDHSSSSSFDRRARKWRSNTFSAYSLKDR